MKEGPNIHFIGKESDELSKQEAEQKLRRRFEAEKIEGIFEREKTPIEQQIIQFVDSETNRVVARYGGTPAHIPSRNVRFIEDEVWQKRGMKRGTAAFDSSIQSILSSTIPQPSVLAKVLFHEMLHFKSVSRYEMIGPILREQRAGIRSFTRPEYQDTFEGLNEAVIEELSKRFIRSADDPLVRPEVDASDMVRSHKGLDDEILYISFLKREADKEYYNIARFAYPNERRNLDLLTQKIAQRTGQTSEEVFDVFARALFSTTLIEPGVLIDRAFGVGTFRKLGMLGPDAQASKEFIESL